MATSASNRWHRPVPIAEDQHWYLYPVVRPHPAKAGPEPQELVHISDRHNILRSKKLGLKTAVIDGIGGKLADIVEIGCGDGRIGTERRTRIGSAPGTC